MKLIALILCGLMMHFYASPAYVSDIANGEVCYTDFATGNDWWESTAENRKLYEEVTLYMCDNNTAEITDDIIVCVRKDGCND